MSLPIVKAREGRISVAVFESPSLSKPGTSYRQYVIQTGRPPAKPGEKWINHKISIFDNQVDLLVKALNDARNKLPKA